jgi:hypothetical protein
MAPLQARRRTTTTTQRTALRRHAQHSALNQQQLASWFEEQFGHRLSPGTTSESLSARFKELDTTHNDGRPQKRLRTHHWPELATCLYEWQLQISLKYLPRTTLSRLPLYASGTVYLPTTTCRYLDSATAGLRSSRGGMVSASILDMVKLAQSTKPCQVSN